MMLWDVFERFDVNSLRCVKCCEEILIMDGYENYPIKVWTKSVAVGHQTTSLSKVCG